MCQICVQIYSIESDYSVIFFKVLYIYFIKVIVFFIMCWRIKILNEVTAKNTNLQFQILFFIKINILYINV